MLIFSKQFPPKHSGILTFTRPRCPVAASYGQSPGPIYKLPGLMGQPDHDPRSVHTKGPAHVLANRTFQKVDNCSPGPIYLPPAKMLRTGLAGAAEYTMAQRFKDISVYCSPGPAAYLPKRTDCDKNFSFGLKQHNTECTASPGKQTGSRGTGAGIIIALFFYYCFVTYPKDTKSLR